MPVINLPADGDKPYGAVLRTAINAVNDAVDDVYDPWLAYTPTFTNFTLGNGTVTARYKVNGKTVSLLLFVTLGTTSTMANDPIFTTPTSIRGAGSGLVFPAALTGPGSQIFLGNAIGFTSNQLLLVTGAVSGSYISLATITASVPFVWASGHTIGVSATYEAA